MSKSEANPADVASIDAIITASYNGISGPAGKKRDWDRERSLFLPGARLIPTATDAGSEDVDLTPQILDVEGFIARAEAFFQNSGFYEKEVARKTEQFGQIAHVWSTYESRHDEDEAEPFMRGKAAGPVAEVATADAPIVNSEVVTLNLHNVTNAQTLGINLTNATSGGRTGNVGIPMGVLLGDTSGNGAVNSSDVSQTQSESGHVLAEMNFKTDVTVNAQINSSDVSTVQAQSGTGLPVGPGASQSSPPQLKGKNSGRESERASRIR